MEKISEFRVDGQRNFIRVGDIVKTKKPGKAPFLARVSEIAIDDDRQTHLTVVIWSKCNGEPHGHRGKWRMATPDEVTRVSQVRWAHLRSDAA